MSKEEIIAFAKYCLEKADGYTSAGCEEINWVIQELDDDPDKIIEEFKKDE